MKSLSPKQITIAWSVAVILLFVHFIAPRLFARWESVLSKHREQQLVTAKPVVAGPVNVDTSSAADAGPAFPLAAQQRFLGVWDGMQMGNSSCQIHLELRPSPYKPGYVAGYETRICYDMAKFVSSSHVRGGLADALKAKSPLATELEGFFSQGDLAFRVSNSIGGSEFTCPLSKYTILPWGAQDVIAQWTASGGCPDGQMILKRGKG